MKPFSFIHAADLHLDSPFKGITADNPAITDSVSSATFDAFNALIALCIQKQVEFLLIAGDVYDGADRSLRAQLRFRDGLDRLAKNEIDSFVVHGNHDPFDSRSSAIEWPNKVHSFGCHKVETKPCERDGTPIALISGISHSRRKETQNLAKRFVRETSELFHIGLLHCNVGSVTGYDPYAPCELSDLVGLGMDYWALGHVHEKAILCKDPHVVYSGNTQGRSIREDGERGCYLVTVSGRSIANVEFHPLDTVRWLRTTISIDGITTLDRLDAALSGAVQSLTQDTDSRSVVCRIEIVGRGPMYDELQKENAVDDLLDRARDNFAAESPFVWVQEIEINCRPEVDLEKRRESKDFLGQVLRIVQETRNSKNTTSKLLESALSELFGSRHIQKALGEFSGVEINRLLEEAELLCLNKLEVGE
ncbi:MAG: DNA repair exonuclease [Thermodesulfobacteriota bacterium]|jgi:DNA repair exonuclease SbcCD nuclease subunit